MGVHSKQVTSQKTGFGVIGMSNEQVVRAWMSSKSGLSNRMRSDGDTLYSYALPIGVTLPDGRKAAIRYQAPRMVSQTTSRHVGVAASYADVVVNAPFWGNIWGPNAAAIWAQLALEHGWTNGKYHQQAHKESEVVPLYGLDRRFSESYGCSVYYLKSYAANEW